MYFTAKSDIERRDWIEILKLAGEKTIFYLGCMTLIFFFFSSIISATDLKGNAMLDHYHSGAYGQVNKQKWSCCNAANRDSQGCLSITAEANGSQLEIPTEQTKAHLEVIHKLIQSSLRTKDTLGTGILSSFRRLSLSRRLAIV